MQQCGSDLKMGTAKHREEKTWKQRTIFYWIWH